MHIAVNLTSSLNSVYYLWTVSRLYIFISEIVVLMPFRWKMVERFIVTVEFIDWKMAAEPTKVVSFFSNMVSCESMTALADESLPNSTPTSLAIK